MADVQLMNWIKDSQTKGYSIQQIKETLLKSGFKEYDVNDALIAVLEKRLPSTSSPKPLSFIQKVREFKKWKKVLLISGAAILLIILILFIWALFPA